MIENVNENRTSKDDCVSKNCVHVSKVRVPYSCYHHSNLMSETTLIKSAWSIASKYWASSNMTTLYPPTVSFLGSHTRSVFEARKLSSASLRRCALRFQRYLNRHHGLPAGRRWWQAFLRFPERIYFYHFSNALFISSIISRCWLNHSPLSNPPMPVASFSHSEAGYPFPLATHTICSQRLPNERLSKLPFAWSAVE